MRPALPSSAKRPFRVIAFLLITTLLVSVLLLLRSSSKNSAVPQPIAFNHRVHVEKRIDCFFCHAYAKSQAQAGLPSIQLCASCHSGLQKRNPEIEKIFFYWENKQEIPWRRVYQLSAHANVVFNHKRHIAASLACTICHGEVGRMAVAERVIQPTMGWCMDCHRRNEAKFPMAKLATDCWTCHK